MDVWTSNFIVTPRRTATLIILMDTKEFPFYSRNPVGFEITVISHDWGIPSESGSQACIDWVRVAVAQKVQGKVSGMIL